MIYLLSVLHSTVSEQPIGLRVGFKQPFFPRTTFFLSPSVQHQFSWAKEKVVHIGLERWQKTEEMRHLSDWTCQVKMAGWGKSTLIVGLGWEGLWKYLGTFWTITRKSIQCPKVPAEYNSCLFRNKLRGLDGIQESSCTVQLQHLLIDFQPGTTLRKHYATGLGPTRGLGALAVVGGETSN